MALAACGGDDSPAPAPTPNNNNNVNDGVPSESSALFEYLKAGKYKSFTSESKVHASGGPHGNVKTFVGPGLESSLKAGNATHPIGIGAVKEIYDTDMTTLKGWAAYVKVEESSGGKGFYWYEVLSTTDGSAPVAAEKGSSKCTTCHSGGKDFVLIDFPFKN
jgi:hypothetical protein